MPSSPRNYKKENENYGSKPEQKKRRAARNAARRKMEKAGKVSKGDGKDIHHSDSNPKNNKSSNLKIKSKSANRSFARNKDATKKTKNGKELPSRASKAK